MPAPSSVMLPVDRLVPIEPDEPREIALERGDVERRVQMRLQHAVHDRGIGGIERRWSSETRATGTCVSRRRSRSRLPCRPLGVATRYFSSSSRLRLGGLVAARDQLVGAPPVERAEACHVHRDRQVRVLQRRARRRRASSRRSSGPSVRTSSSRPSSSGACPTSTAMTKPAPISDHVGGNVVERAAVDEDAAVALDRRKHRGQRHRRAQRGRQLAAVDHDLLARLADRRRRRGTASADRRTAASA